MNKSAVGTTIVADIYKMHDAGCKLYISTTRAVIESINQSARIGRERRICLMMAWRVKNDAWSAHYQDGIALTKVA